MNANNLATYETLNDHSIPSNFFSPASIITLFNAAIVTKEEKKIIQDREIFKKNAPIIIAAIIATH